MSVIESPGIPPLLAGPVPPRAPLSFVKYARTVRRNFIAGFHEDAYRQDVVETRFIGMHMFLVNDPAGIRRILLDNSANYPKAKIEQRILGPALGNGLITSVGETWRSHRRILAPFFDHRSIQSCASVMTDAAARLVSQWDALPAGSMAEVSNAMMQLTLEIISRSMFSSDSEGIAEIIRDSSERYQEAMMFGLIDFTPVLADIWADRKFKRGKAILKSFDEAIHRLIAARAENPDGGRGSDLLERLISARDEETGAGMSAEEVRDQVLTIFVAGHETTALALMWTWYLLSLHPVEEARLHAELESALDGRVPAYDDIARLPYTRMVIQESMRLYPPLHSLTWREALSADEVCGRRIPKGAIVSIVPWVLHRHQSFWDRPERFEPERFAPEASAARDRLTYLPFGFGPRVCIGASFSMTEAALILATLAQRYRLRLAPGHPVEPQALITLKARYGMKMILESYTGRRAEG
jgi:cytochrome P450